MGITASITAVERDTQSALNIRNDLDTGNLTNLVVPENGSVSYKIKLPAQPAADVTVTLAVTGDTDITVDETSLTFTSGNFFKAQTVTVSAAGDTDLANGTATISHTASGGGYNGVTASLTAQELDDTGNVEIRNADDSAYIGDINVPENGSVTYKVKLSHQPLGNVSVSISLQSSADGGDTDITASPTSLSFNASNWNQAKTVTLSAADDTDKEAGSRNIDHTATGGGYNSTTSVLTATEAENDLAVILNPVNNISVTEGSTAAFTVKLSTAPTANVTVTVAAATTGDNTDASITASPASLTFSTTTWNTTQNVTLTAAEDTDFAHGKRDFTLTANGGGYTNESATITATEAESDKGIHVSPSALTVTETGSATYTVNLGAAPSASVNVAVFVGNGDSDITFSPASLTFTTTNYSTPQTVTVSAAADADAIAGTRTITHDGASADSVYDTKQATVTVTEGEPPVLIRDAADDDITTLSVPEGSSATYKVKLSSQPSSNVTVYLDLQSNSGNNAGDSNINRTPPSLTFTTQDWGTAQTVTVSASEDGDTVNGSRTISHRVTGGGYTNAGAGVLTATEVENDAAIILSKSAVSVTEEGTATYTVVLSTAPTANVTVTIAEGTGANDDTDITVTTPSSPKTLTFNTTNWSTAQDVTLSAAADTDLVNGRRVITHTAANGGYDSITASLTATEADNDNNGNILVRNSADTAAITTLGVPEGSTATYKVKLDKQPRADVTVTIAEGSGDPDLTVSSPSNKQLTFTSSTWNTAQTVTLRAAQDSGAFFGTRPITHTAAGADSGYSAAPTVNLTANEMEDDVSIAIHDGSHVDINTITVREGSTATYHVELSAQPMSDVTVTLSAASGDDDITFSPASLTFSASNWQTGQVVTISAAADSDTANGTKTITHTATGGGYGNAPTASMTVTEQDGPSLAVTTGAHTVSMTISQHTTAWWFKHGGNNAQCTAVTAGTATATASNLTKNTEYTFTAYSENTCTTALTPAVKTTTLNPELTSSGVTATTATLTLSNWNISLDGNWWYKHTTGTCSSTAQTTLTANVTGLTKATSYTFSAYNDNGCAGSMEIDAAPQFTTTNPALAATAGDASATLTLSNWVTASDGNWWYKHDQTGAACTPNDTTGLSALTTTATGLTGSTAHIFSAYSNSNCSTLIATAASVTPTSSNTGSGQPGPDPTPSQPAQQEPEPQPPASVGSVSASRSDGNIVANWPAVDGATKYHVTYSADGGGSWHAPVDNHRNHPTNSISFSGDAGKIYIVGVRAGNDAGWSGWVNSNQVPAEGATEPPGEIAVVVAIHRGDRVVASWQAAKGADSYHVTYSSDGGGSWSLADLKHTGTDITINNANKTKTYVVGVRAQNAAGYSSWKNSNPASPPDDNKDDVATTQ